ncbi:hypothetical protein [Thiomonas delicata]|uniref:Uncharacterized protein n=1 Tax=Thiomonas delicata TaxID=364030 RepID=A0A238DAA7_THIDL|nr:hypothetical protein [Thiomonas delicata]SBP90044.1 hypothetical protein THIARS_90194 [Thiomonas delicata]
MQTPLDADAAALPHAGLAAGLRDLTLALFWSDAAAGVRGCRRLAQRATRAGLPPQQARLRATHRLLAGMVIVTLCTPPLGSSPWPQPVMSWWAARLKDATCCWR